MNSTRVLLSNKILTELLPILPPSKIRSYLMSHGWILEGGIGGSVLSPVATIWHRREPQNKDLEIIQPENGNIRDFQQRQWDLICVLSEFEQRAVDEITKDISQL